MLDREWCLKMAILKILMSHEGLLTLRQISLSCASTSFTRLMFLLLTKFSRHHSCKTIRRWVQTAAPQHDCTDAFPGVLALPHLVAADFLKSSVDVEQRHVVSFTGGELLAHSLHLFPPCRGVIKHAVHWEQGHDAQDLLGAGELGGQQDGLWHRANDAHYSITLLYTILWLGCECVLHQYKIQGLNKTKQNTDKHHIENLLEVFFFYFNLGISGLQRETGHLLSQSSEENLALLPLHSYQLLQMLHSRTHGL